MKLHGIYMALIVVLALFSLHQCDRNKGLELSLEAENGSHVQQIARKQAQIDTLLSQVARTHSQARKDKAKDSIAMASLKRANKRQDVKSADLRIPVQVLIDTVEALGAFVASQDSSLAQKDVLIAKCDSSAYNQARMASNEIGKLHAAIEKQEEIGESWRQFSGSESKKAKKERNKKKFWRSVSVILTGAVLATILSK